MLKTSVVCLSRRGTNVDLALDDLAPFDDVVRELREYLARNRALCSEGIIAVNLGRRMLRPAEVSRIKQILEKESGLTIASFWCSPDILEGALSQDVAAGDLLSETTPKALLSGRTNGNPDVQAAIIPPAQFLHQGVAVDRDRAKGPKESNRAEFGHLSGTDALIVKTTCRSGKTIRHSGDVVVRADVNPGAEIFADGDILVFGSLRGLVHAGAAGDTRAAIVALKLDVPWLQIGHYTWTAPGANQRPKSTGTGPKIAYVRRGSIHVASFVGHGRGTLYDR